jgi:hypothetical protein
MCRTVTRTLFTGSAKLILGGIGGAVGVRGPGAQEPDQRHTLTNVVALPANVRNNTFQDDRFCGDRFVAKVGEVCTCYATGVHCNIVPALGGTAVYDIPSDSAIYDIPSDSVGAHPPDTSATDLTTRQLVSFLRCFPHLRNTELSS